jgi:hypothetical protein
LLVGFEVAAIVGNELGFDDAKDEGETVVGKVEGMIDDLKKLELQLDF